MDRAMMEGNRVCNNRSLKLNRIIHKEKIKNAAKGVNNAQPYTY